MRRGFGAALAVPGLMLALPGAACACSVCGIGPGPSNTAFMISTLFLSFLPLLAIAGGVMWLRVRVRRGLAGEFEERPSPVAPVSRPEPADAPSLAGIRPAEA